MITNMEAKIQVIMPIDPITIAFIDEITKLTVMRSVKVHNRLYIVFDWLADRLSKTME